MPIGSIAPAVIGAGASLLGARQAAKSSQKATDAALALQERQYDLSRADMWPYIQAGIGALGDYRDNIANMPAWSFTPQTYQESPGLRYLVDRTLDQVQARGAAGGYRLSEPMLLQLAETTQGLLSQDYYQQQALSRANYESDRNFRTNGLYNLAGLGLNAAGQVSGAGQAYATTGANALLNSGAGQAAQAQSAAGTFNSLLQQGVDAYNARRRPATVQPPPTRGPAGSTLLQREPYYPQADIPSDRRRS